VLEEDTGEQLENVLQPEDGEELDEWIVEELQLLATGFPIISYLLFKQCFRLSDPYQLDLSTDPGRILIKDFQNKLKNF